MRKFWGLVLFGLLFANNALADVGVEDGGQYAAYECSQEDCLIEASGAINDSSITGGQNCATSESLCYDSKGTVTLAKRKTTSCTSCPSGYVMIRVLNNGARTNAPAKQNGHPMIQFPA